MKYGQALIKYLLIKDDYQEFIDLKKIYAPIPGIGYPQEIRPTVLEVLKKIEMKSGIVFSDIGYKMYKGRLRTNGYIDNDGELTEKGYKLIKTTIDKIKE